MIINTSNHATDVKICQVPFTLFIFKIFIDTFGTSFTCTHGKDNSSCTCNGITTGIYAVLGCLTGFFLGNDTSSLVDVKALGCGKQGFCFEAYGGDRTVSSASGVEFNNGAVVKKA